MAEHPGKPNCVMCLNVFLKKPPEQHDMEELALWFRHKWGALAVEAEGFPAGSETFDTIIRNMATAMKTDDIESQYFDDIAKN